MRLPRRRTASHTQAEDVASARSARRKVRVACGRGRTVHLLPPPHAGSDPGQARPRLGVFTSSLAEHVTEEEVGEKRTAGERTVCFFSLFFS